MNALIDIGVMLSEAPAAENWIQIMKTGKWDHPKYGPMEITQADLQQFKDNYDKRIRGVDLAVDVSHNPDAGGVGWFKELKVEPGKLMARVAWTPEGKEMLETGKFRYFSPEFAFSYKDPESKQVIRNVLLGGAITNRPFLKNMAPIELSESTADIDPDFVLLFKANGDDSQDKPFDPDHDNDDDSTTDPNKNPDWIDDVKHGYTAWPSDEKQQAQLVKAGITKEDADKARKAYLRKHPPGSTQMSEPSNDDDKKQEQAARAKKYGISAKEGGNLTKPGQYNQVPDDKFADPVNYRYPITPEYAMAAYRYFAKPENQSDYTPAERKKIAGRIVAALPEADRDNAKKTFKLDDGTNPIDNEMNGQLPGGNSNAKPTDDTNAGKFKEPGGANTMETVSLAEHQAVLDRVKAIETENRRLKLSETVKGFMYNESTKKGKIAPAQKDAVLEFMAGLDDEQVTKFTEIVNKLPDAISFGEENGHGGQTPTKTRDELVDERAEVLLSEGKAKDFREALLMADREIQL